MFNKLFQPGAIGKIQLKNRIIMAPMGTWLPAEDGSVTEQLINYYSARAVGGAGAIIVEAAYLTTGQPKRLSIANQQCIPGLKRLSDAIHDRGAKAFIQIHPSKGRFDEKDPVSASEVLSRTYKAGPTGAKTRPLTLEEIEKMVFNFGEAALRAKEAGFDGIEVHAGHGYLVADFISPIVNMRTDEYGGSLENRTRLAVELIKSSKQSAGKDYAFIFRLSIDEIKGTLSLEEATIISQILEKAGADAIDIDSGGAENKEWVGAPYYVAPGYNAYYAHRIKNSVNIPISVAGRINDAHIAEKILADDKADFVTLGRALIADPAFPNKAMMGKTDDIRKCISCQQCFETILAHGKSLKCSVNPFVEGKAEEEITHAEKLKKVLVIGGGPGGMQAAIVSSLRGHSVTLWEKTKQLGGQLNLATTPPCKGEISNFTKYLETRLEETSVKVERGKEANLTSILAFKPDAVIVATGSRPIIPQVPGETTVGLITAHDVLAGKVNIGQRVVIIGGGAIGCETADYLAGEGRQVAIVEMLTSIAEDSPIRTRPFLLARLKRNGVEVFTNVTREKMTDEGLEVVVDQGKPMLLPADSIVCACGSKPDNELFLKLEGKMETYAIGDCLEPRKIMDAVREGTEVGRRV